MSKRIALLCLGMVFCALTTSNAQIAWQSSYPSTVSNYSLGSTVSGPVFAYTNNTLLRSDAAGDAGTWNSVPNPAIGGSAELFSGGKMLFLLEAGKSLRRSRDNGATWHYVHQGLIGNDSTRLRAVIPISESSFVLVHNGSSVNKVFVSFDTGASWSATLNMTSQSVVSVVPRGTDVFLITTSKVYKSDDGGQNWDDQSAVFPATGAGKTVALSNGQLLMRSQNAFYTSANNGATWALLPTTGLHPSATARQLIKSPASDTLYMSVEVTAAPTYGLVFSADGGHTWIDCSAGLPANPRIAPLGGYGYSAALMIGYNGYLYASVSSEGIYRTASPVTTSRVVATPPAGITNAASATLGLRIFPNPVQSTLTATYLRQAEDCVLCVTDALGKIVVGERTIPAGALPTTSFDVSNLRPGIYFMQIRSGKNMATRKFYRQ